MKQQRYSFRKKTGQAATMLNLLMSGLVLLLLGVFAWELSLYLLAKDQLKTCVEVAALTCETTLCSSGDVSLKDQAKTTAYNLFCRNTILGNSLAGTPPPVSVPSDLNPAPGEANICFQFLDPVTRSAVNVIGPQGAIIEADGAYCYQPIFGRFLGLSNVTFTVLVSAQAGLPRTDVVICFDICGVGDDATMVTFVQRFWDYNSNPQHIVYSIPWLPENPPTPGQYGFGPLGALGCFPPDSQTTNVMPPQDMAQMQTNPTTTCPLPWSEVPSPAPGNPNQPAVGLAGVSLASPPGNLCFTSPGVPATSSVPSKLEIAQASKNKKKPTNTGNKATIPAASKPTQTSSNTAFPKVNRPFVSAKPESKYKFCSQPGLASSDLEDVYVDVKNGQNDHSLFSKYSPKEIIAVAGPTSAPTGNYTTITNPVGTGPYVTLLVTGSSAPGGPINYSLIPPANTFPCSGSNSPVAYVEDPNAPYFTGATEVVQNLDNAYMFQSYNGGGFNYPDLAVVVEAARGNLESVATANAAGLDLVALNVTPQAGYQQNYIDTASLNTQPFNLMRNNLQSLLDMVYRVSDVHFGLVVFNGIVGVGPADTFHKNKWDTYYLPAGAADYPIPQIFLNNASGIVATNYSAITNVLPTLHIYGKRDTGLALRSAIDQLTPSNGYCRTWANKAIVLITDGPPTHDSTSSFAPNTALSEANVQAQRAHDMGIPIYVICVDPIKDNDVNDTPAYDENVSGSICHTAGHGSKYYFTAWPQAQNQTAPDMTPVQRSVLGAVGNVARQLNTLLH